MKRIIEYFDRAYIINLEDRLDRREEVIQEFGQLGINVPNQNVRFYTAKRLTEKGLFPDVGTRGNFTSHRNVLRLASQDGLRNVLVFEDDVSFRDCTASLEDQIVTQLARNAWDIVYFGYLLPSDTGLEGGPLVDFPKEIVGAHFYAVNCDFINPLLQFMDQCEVRPAGHPDGGPMTADGALNHIRFLIPDMRVLLAVPSLAHQRSSRTDIHPTRIFDRTVILRPLIRRARAIKHKLRMAVERSRLRRRSRV
jgi:glycosyl transferase family 25